MFLSENVPFAMPLGLSYASTHRVFSAADLIGSHMHAGRLEAFLWLLILQNWVSNRHFGRLSGRWLEEFCHNYALWTI